MKRVGSFVEMQSEFSSALLDLERLANKTLGAVHFVGFVVVEDEDDARVDEVERDVGVLDQRVGGNESDARLGKRGRQGYLEETMRVGARVGKGEPGEGGRDGKRLTHETLFLLSRTEGRVPQLKRDLAFQVCLVVC